MCVIHPMNAHPARALDTLLNDLDLNLLRLAAMPCGTRIAAVLQLPDLLAAVMLVARAELVCTVPAKLAQAAAESLPVQSTPVPFELPAFTIHQYWHPRAHRDAAVQWLRERLAERFAESPAARGRPRRRPEPE